MRRPPHGGSVRPGLVRPASGFGRSPRRPGPAPVLTREARAHREWWAAAVELVAAATGVNPTGALEQQV